MALWTSRVRKRRERTVFLPWERRRLLGGLRLPRHRLRALILLAAAISCVAWMRSGERTAREIRVTRNTIAFVSRAIDAYRADHAGQCPADLETLTKAGDRPGYLRATPLDAWKRPLRFACPSLDPSRAFDLLSDGPDGIPFGLDRVE